MQTQTTMYCLISLFLIPKGSRGTRLIKGRGAKRKENQNGFQKSQIYPSHSLSQKPACLSTTNRRTQSLREKYKSPTIIPSLFHLPSYASLQPPHSASISPRSLCSFMSIPPPHSGVPTDTG